MGIKMGIILLFLSLVNLVHMTQRLGMSSNMTSNSTTPRSNSELKMGKQGTENGHGNTSRITIAVVLGVGLTVLILSCIGFFLCRGHLEQKRFINHRQLLKMERLNKNVTSSESKLEDGQSKDFSEEVL